MARTRQTRRRFLQALSSVAVASASSSFAKPPDQVDERPSEGEPDAPSGVPVLDASAFRRLPDLPGKVKAVCFSPDDRQLAMIISEKSEPGLALFTIDVDKGAEFRRLCPLTNAKEGYSLSWEPNGGRLALTVLEHRPDDVKSYQTCLYVVDSRSGKVDTRAIVWSERNPIDGNGVRISIAWLGPDAFLMTREGSVRVHKFSLSDRQLVDVYRMATQDVDSHGHWSPPTAVDDMHASVNLVKITRAELPPIPKDRDLKAQVAIAEQRTRMMLNRSAVLGVSRIIFDHRADSVSTEKIPPLSVPAISIPPANILMGRIAYLRSYASSGPTNWLREVVTVGRKDVVVRLSGQSPFAIPGASGTTRIDLGLSSTGLRLALLERDAFQKPELDRTERSNREPYGRIVVADFRSVVPH